MLINKLTTGSTHRGFNTIKEEIYGENAMVKSAILTRFAPLFAQKTVKDKFDSLSSPKDGSSMNIPKEALSLPFVPSSPRDDLIKIIDDKFKKAALNKQKALLKMERTKYQNLRINERPSVSLK
jgi:hypothetical protein